MVIVLPRCVSSRTGTELLIPVQLHVLYAPFAGRDADVPPLMGLGGRALAAKVRGRILRKTRKGEHQKQQSSYDLHLYIGCSSHWLGRTVLDITCPGRQRCLKFTTKKHSSHLSLIRSPYYRPTTKVPISDDNKKYPGFKRIFKGLYFLFFPLLGLKGSKAIGMPVFSNAYALVIPNAVRDLCLL